MDSGKISFDAIYQEHAIAVIDRSLKAEIGTSAYAIEGRDAHG